MSLNQSNVQGMFELKSDEVGEKLNDFKDKRDELNSQVRVQLDKRNEINRQVKELIRGPEAEGHQERGEWKGR